ncbi:hypothetical protein [Virgibacillus pantothenticus]|uniref:hypothetical protein n=1 Tax=Virgibacillus pantothenticus TaxID=1473 RepID=UPI000986184E|nr:hypothetical protein [Virgibacillus pantothenticus]
MDCCCKRGETRELIIEADIGADPAWCKHCRCNLDIEDLPISQGLMDELEAWSAQYGKWIDWEKEQLLPHAAQQEFAYNEGGYTLLHKLQAELRSTYSIQFIPGSTVDEYEAL